MPSCSAIDLAENRRCHCFGSSRTRCITGGKITTFKLYHPVFDGGIRWCIFPYNFYQNGVNFLRRLALQEKKNLTVRVSVLLKSRPSPDMLPSSLCNKKRLAILAHEQTPLSNDTIDSVLRHREVGRAKDLSAPPSKCILTLRCYRSTPPPTFPQESNLLKPVT